MSKVTVYTKDNCFQCKATTRLLSGKGIDFATINVANDQAAANHLKALGYLQAPVVITDDDQWSGFRPDKITALSA